MGSIRGLLMAIKTIEQEWDDFMESCINTDNAEVEAISSVRSVFYAGAFAVLSSTAEQLADKVSKEEAQEWFKEAYYGSVTVLKGYGLLMGEECTQEPT